METYASSTGSPLPHKSPARNNLLRPRRSFQRLPFSSKPGLLNGADTTSGNSSKLKSPVKLDGNAASSERVSSGGRLRKASSMLFQKSPTVQELPRVKEYEDRHTTSTSTTPISNSPSTSHSPATNNATRSSRPGQREVAGLKRLTGTFTNAFGKTRSSTALRKAFDLGDWNQDLAAIASRPSSSRPTSPSPPDDPNEARVTAQGDLVRRRGSETSDMSSPVNEMSPRVVRPRPSSSRAGADFSSRLEPPQTESRRRKSDEMEDEERDSFQQLQSPVIRREATHHHAVIGGGGGGGSHTRSHSLAHAHTLRSSRMLAFQAGGGGNDSNVSSSANARAATSLTFDNPFLSNNSAPSIVSPTNQPPPLKRISVERLGNLGEIDSDNSSLSADDAVFGGPTLPASSNQQNAAPRKLGRAKSLSKPPSIPSFNIVPIPASSSHPGFDTDKLSPALSAGLPTPTPQQPSSVSRTRATSNIPNLDTLDESGPARDYFSSSGSGFRDGNLTPGGGIAGGATSTPPRRRSDGGGFSLFGANQPSSSSTAAYPSNRRHSMLPQTSGFSFASSSLSSHNAPSRSVPAASTSASTSLPDMALATDSGESTDDSDRFKPPPLPRLRPLHPTTGRRPPLSLTPIKPVNDEDRRRSSTDENALFGELKSLPSS